MPKQIILNGVKYDTARIIKFKGRGQTSTVSKDKLILTGETVVTNETSCVIVYPQGDKFVVLVRPEADLRDKQQIVIMSKYVMKKLTEVSTNVPTQDSRDSMHYGYERDYQQRQNGFQRRSF